MNSNRFQLGIKKWINHINFHLSAKYNDG
jgi:hypothetical protein